MDESKIYEINIGQNIIEIELPGGTRGKKGDKGDTGPAGPQGPVGPIGPQGEKGDKGDPGTSPTASVASTETGAIVTVTDDSGTSTAILTHGAKGDKGEKGDTGETGPQGPKGDKGDTGSVGPKGDTGNTGPQGPKGDKGDTGPKGDAGNDGFSPTITSSKSGKTTTLTITDVNGTSTATILDGEDGPVYTAGEGIDITNGVISNTQTSAEWGNITGTLSDQTDLQTALNGKANANSVYEKAQIDAFLQAKQDSLVSGTNIKTINNESLLGSGNITIESEGSGIIELESPAYMGDLEEGIYRFPKLFQLYTGKENGQHMLFGVNHSDGTLSRSGGTLEITLEDDGNVGRKAFVIRASDPIDNLNGSYVIRGSLTGNDYEVPSYTSYLAPVFSVYNSQYFQIPYSGMTLTVLKIAALGSGAGHGSVYRYPRTNPLVYKDSGGNWQGLMPEQDGNAYIYVQEYFASDHNSHTKFILMQLEYSSKKWQITTGDVESSSDIGTVSAPYYLDDLGSLFTTINNKQDTLVSGTNIKTINNQSILGSGNVDISGGPIELTSPFYLGDLEDGTYIFPENSVMYTGTEAGEHELFAPYYNPDPTSSEPGTLGPGKGTLTITTGEPDGSYAGARSRRYFTLEITSEHQNWYKINGISDSRGYTGLTYNAFLAPTFTQYASEYREVTEDGHTYKLPIVRDMANTSLPSLYRMRAPVVYSEGTGGALYLQGDGYLLVKKYIYRDDWETKFLALLLNKTTGLWEVKSGQWGDVTLQTIELEKLSIIIDSFGAQELTWINPSQETHQYAVGDLVTGNGLIFRCIQAHSNDTQNSHPYYAYYATSTYWEMTTMWDVVEGLINDKQDKLISGTNIKTINNQSLLGSGDITISGGGDSRYLGEISEYSTRETALDITDLDVGTYFLGTNNPSTSYMRLWIKLTSNGVTSTTVVQPYYGSMPNESGVYTSAAYSFAILRINVKTSDASFYYKGYLETPTSYGDYGTGRDMRDFAVRNNALEANTGTFYMYQMMLLNRTQTVTGKKTFNVLPESSVTPTTDYQLVNKAYVDSIAGGGGSSIDLSDFLAPEYSSSSTYDSGDIVIYDNDLYMCMDDSVTGTWDSTSWQAIKVSDLFGDLNYISYVTGDLPINMECVVRWAESELNRKAYSDNFASDYDSTSSYAVGDYVMKDGSLYKCNTAISGGEAWNSSHWTFTPITSEIGNIETILTTLTTGNGV